MASFLSASIDTAMASIAVPARNGSSGRDGHPIGPLALVREAEIDSVDPYSTGDDADPTSERNDSDGPGLSFDQGGDAGRALGCVAPLRERGSPHSRSTAARARPLPVRSLSFRSTPLTCCPFWGHRVRIRFQDQSLRAVRGSMQELSPVKYFVHLALALFGIVLALGLCTCLSHEFSRARLGSSAGPARR
jgi:hypothetical protein